MADEAETRRVADAILGLDPGIRYVSIADGDGLTTVAAPERANASASESDYYEERLVNPTMLDLARRRGDEGCGGFDFIVIRYGAFYQLLLPANAGHISVCLELSASVAAVLPHIARAGTSLGVKLSSDASSEPRLTREPFVRWDGEPDSRGEAALSALYAVSPEVRYVALNRGGRLVLSSRVGDPAESDRSDRYEELIVNPTLLTLASTRGAIDCGGLRYLVVAYPGFFALVLPLEGGHATVSLPRTADPAGIAAQFEAALVEGTSADRARTPREL